MLLGNHTASCSEAVLPKPQAHPPWSCGKMQTPTVSVGLGGFEAPQGHISKEMRWELGEARLSGRASLAMLHITVSSPAPLQTSPISTSWVGWDPGICRFKSS